MTADLGMFTLHQRAAHARYLGSSSGTLFEPLMSKESPVSMHGTAPVASRDVTPELVDVDGEESGSEHAASTPRVPLLATLRDVLPLRDASATG